MTGSETFSRNVVLYLVARFCSATALAMLRAAIAWQVFDLSRSAFQLGLIGIVQFVPALGLSLVGGAVADSSDRRRVILRTGLVPLSCALLLWAQTERGAAGLAMLYAIVFVVAIAAAFENPARAALLPSLVTRDAFPRVVAAASTNTALALATGPAACGLVIADFGVGTAYAVVAVLVLGSLVALVALEAPVAESGRLQGWSAIREGLSFVRRNPVVLGCMTLDMLAVVFGGAAALLPIYATDILRVGARGYGFLASALDLGAIACSVLLTLLPPIRRAGPALLGSVNMIFIGASNQLGAAESGFLAALTSPTVSVVAGGVASLAVVAAVALAVPELRRYRLEQRGDVGA